MSHKPFESSLFYHYCFISRANLKTGLAWHILGVLFENHHFEVGGSMKRAEDHELTPGDITVNREQAEKQKDMVEF